MPDVFVADDHKKKKGGGDKGKKPVGHRDETDYSELMRTEPRTKSSLAAFMVRPKGIKFETQDSKEKILLLLRRHPITNVGWILITLLGLVAPLILTYVPLISFLPNRFQMVSLILWYLLFFGYAFEKFLDWYFSVYVITDERVIDFDFYSLVYKRVSEAKIDSIQDVTFEMTGVLRSLFNFGSVYIQTAGESREFEFDDTPMPQKVAKFLNELILEEEREKIEGRVR